MSYLILPRYSILSSIIKISEQSIFFGFKDDFKSKSCGKIWICFVSELIDVSRKMEVKSFPKFGFVLLFLASPDALEVIVVTDSLTH